MFWSWVCAVKRIAPPESDGVVCYRNWIYHQSVLFQGERLDCDTQIWTLLPHAEALFPSRTSEKGHSFFFWHFQDWEYVAADSRTADEWQIGKDFEGNSCGLNEALSWHEKPFRIAGDMAKIQTEHLPNTSLECYLQTNLCGGRRLCSKTYSFSRMAQCVTPQEIYCSFCARSLETDSSLSLVPFP
jgi:hypothetical protein